MKSADWYLLYRSAQFKHPIGPGAGRHAVQPCHHRFKQPQVNAGGLFFRAPGKQFAQPQNGGCRNRQGDHLTHVFTYEGKPIVQVNTKAWRAVLKRVDIEDFRWHDLRHTFATWHRQAGTPTHELQRLGGWKTLEMVERYAHVAPEGLQVAASRLNNVFTGTF